MKARRWILGFSLIFITSGGWCAQEGAAPDLGARVQVLEQELRSKTRQLEEIQASLKQVLTEVQSLKQQKAGPPASVAFNAFLDKTYALEKAQEVKKFTQYVCSNGHILQQDSPNHQCPDCGKSLKATTFFKKVRLARRESVSEKIESLLEEGEKKRVQVGLSGTGVLQQILDAQTEHDSTFGEGSVDLIFVARPLTYGLFFVDLEGVGGNGQDAVLRTNANLNADAGSLQDTDGVDRVRVREAWGQLSFFSNRLECVVGKIDLSNYFDQNAVANDETTQFLTGAFVNNPILQAPTNGPGASLLWDNKKGQRLRAAVQKPGNSGFRVSERVYGIGQAETQSNWFYGREGNYRAWGRISGNTEDENVGFGVSFDQLVWPEWTAFARYGVGEPSVRDLLGKWAWSGGLQKEALLPFRLKDAAAVALGQQKGPSKGRDLIAETYYRIFFSENFATSLNLQWLAGSGGDVDTVGETDNAWLAGIRTQIDF